MRPFAFAATLAAAATAFSALAAGHPSLVDPASTNCLTCHADLMSAPVQHAAALSDCRTCHEFAKAEGKTTVALNTKLPDLCVTCHDQREKQAAGSVSAPHFPVTDSCTNCHTPHSSANARLLTTPAPALCLTCHDGEALAVPHKRNVSSSNCLSCHDAHGSDVKGMLRVGKQHPPFAERSCQACHKQGTIGRNKPRSAELCFACHAKAKFAGNSVHTAVQQGRCVECHDPHLASETKLTRVAGPALCIGCHPKIKEKLSAASVHPPAKDDCTTCHDPHRSEHARQLAEEVPALCLTCHDATDKKLASKHLGANLTTTNCVACHDPHGSPEKTLLAAASVHPPFADRTCATCHQGSAAKLIEEGSRQLCFACHGEIKDAIGKARVQHPALDAVECTACHSPHASAQTHLVIAAGGGECLACHVDKAPEKGEFLHGVISAIGCRACHEPHGGSRERLLRVDASRICLGCHDPSQRKADGNGGVVLLTSLRLEGTDAQRGIPSSSLQIVDGVVRNHPVTGHRATGKPTPEELKHASTTFKGELGCLSCHDPHKGVSSRHFVNNAHSAAELCLQCHQK